MTSRQTWNAALELSKRAEKQADPTGEECANLPPSGRLDTGAVSLPDMFSWMITRDDRPLLYLNVDGPLIPFRARPLDHGPTLRTATAPAEASGNPLVDRLDPTDGRRLLALGCQLVWATTWMADANEVVAPRLGLAELPIVDFPDEESPERGLRWKTKPLAQDAGNRPSIWLDDEITDADQRWVRTHHQGPALLHRVDPLVGLTDADFAAIRRWLTAQ